MLDGIPEMSMVARSVAFSTFLTTLPEISNTSIVAGEANDESSA